MIFKKKHWIWINKFKPGKKFFLKDEERKIKTIEKVIVDSRYPPKILIDTYERSPFYYVATEVDYNNFEFIE